MSQLSDARRGHRAPHLVTVLDGRAHVVPVTADVAGDAFRVDAPGRRTRAAVGVDPRSRSSGHPPTTAGTA